MVLKHARQPSRIARIALALTASLLGTAGCLVGPDYHAPETKTPAGWVSLVAPTTRASAIATDHPAMTALWWETFHDHTLDRLVREALASNLDLVQAEARLRQARAQRGINASGLWPAVDLAGSYRRSGSEGQLNAPSRSGTRSDLYQAGFDASWEIDVFGGVRRSVEASDAEIDAAVADLMDVRVSLVAEIAVNYFDLRSAQQRYAIALKNLETQRRSLEVTRTRKNGGFVGGLDLVNAEAQVANTQTQLPQLELAARTAAFDIALLLGREPGALIDQLTVPGSIPPVPPEVPAGLPSDLLRRRPDIRRAESQLHAETARVGIATADLFPRFSLTGSFGTQSRKANGLLNWNSTIWSFGPSVSWNIFDAGRIRSNIAATDARREEAVAFYQKSVLTAFHDVEVALTAYDYEQRRRILLQVAVEANRRAVNLATSLYAQGQTDFLNVLTAQRELLSTEDALVQSDRNVAANLVAIYKSLGGGWEEAVPPTTTPAATQPVVDTNKP